jgi:hypothetical protein
MSAENEMLPMPVVSSGGSPTATRAASKRRTEPHRRVWAEHGWREEAHQASALAVVRAARIGDGRPFVIADVHARLARTLRLLAAPQLALEHARTALQSANHLPGASSAYDDRSEILARIMT